MGKVKVSNDQELVQSEPKTCPLTPVATYFKVVWRKSGRLPKARAGAGGRKILLVLRVRDLKSLVVKRQIDNPSQGAVTQSEAPSLSIYLFSFCFILFTNCIFLERT